MILLSSNTLTFSVLGSIPVSNILRLSLLYCDKLLDKSPLTSIQTVIGPILWGQAVTSVTRCRCCVVVVVVVVDIDAQAACDSSDTW